MNLHDETVVSFSLLGKNVIHHGRPLGPLVRISPNEVSVDDVDANNVIYAQNNPWVKPAYHYKAFRSSPEYSIFTELDPSTHAAHARLLAPAFSQARVAAPDAQRLVWDKCNAMVQGMRRHMAAERRREDGSSTSTVTVGLNRAFRSFALDVVTTWTFGHCADSLPSFHSELFEIFDAAAESVIYVSPAPFFAFFSHSNFRHGVIGLLPGSLKQDHVWQLS